MLWGKSSRTENSVFCGCFSNYSNVLQQSAAHYCTQHCSRYKHSLDIITIDGKVDFYNQWRKVKTYTARSSLNGSSWGKKLYCHPSPSSTFAMKQQESVMFVFDFEHSLCSSFLKYSAILDSSKIKLLIKNVESEESNTIGIQTYSSFEFLSLKHLSKQQNFSSRYQNFNTVFANYQANSNFLTVSGSSKKWYCLFEHQKLHDKKIYVPQEDPRDCNN